MWNRSPSSFSLAYCAYCLSRCIINRFLLDCKSQVLWLIKCRQYLAKVFAFIIFLLNTGKELGRENRKERGRGKQELTQATFESLSTWSRKNPFMVLLKRKLGASRVRPTQVPGTLLSKCSAPEIILETGVDDMVSGSQSSTKNSSNQNKCLDSLIKGKKALLCLGRGTGEGVLDLPEL